MTRISNAFSLLLRRALATPELLAIRFAGVLVAVTLVAGVSLYSAAMGDAMLQQRVQTDPSNVNVAVSVSGQALAPSVYAALDSYVRHREASDITLPLHGLHIHHNTTTVAVFRQAAANSPLHGKPLADLSLDYYEGLQSQIIMIDGSLTVPDLMANGDAPVFISEHTARTLHLQRGDHLAYSVNNVRPLAPRLVVAGIYVPKNFKSDFWDIHSGDSSYISLMAPNLGTFQTIAARSGAFSPEYFWLQVVNGKDIHLAAANAMLDGLDRASSQVANIASGATLITSLGLTINGFLDQYNLLPDILLILVTPIVALILYAVAVTAALALDRQAAEIVLIRSRGATRGQVFALYVGEGIVLGVVALIIGPPLGLPLARLIGRASGFLTFSGSLPFELRLGMDTYIYSAITLMLCILAGLLPAMALARRSMMSFKGEQARPRGRPLWQRLYLDIVALAVSLYGLDLLVRQGPVNSGSATAVVAQDPLIAIAPLLFAIAVTLLLSRVLPWLAALGLHLLGALSSPSAHVALQSVARAPRQPMRLVQLCTLTLTLGIFAATVAGVEARNQTDQYMYQAGATVRLIEILNRKLAPPYMRKEPDIMPLAMHLALPGVHDATPILRFESTGNVVNSTDDGTSVDVMGIDPSTAASTIWYRPDFADQPLSTLLKAVSSPGPNAIVSDSFLSATGLRRGDTFTVNLTNNVAVSFKIAAVAHYFPSLDPTEYPFVVTNLAYLQKASKSFGPNEVWLNTTPTQSTIDQILVDARTWPRQIVDYQGLPPADASSYNPLATGIYGVVSVGFLIATALALLGFITYAYLTLQQRLGEVAILRALGLSQRQVRSLLLFEQVFLLGAAILGGIVAGLLTTQLFLPFLPIATNVVPPFLVVMPWFAVGEFVLAILIVFVAVLSGHVTLLLRVQLGRVLRLGEG